MARLRFQPDLSAMPLHNLFAYRKSNTSAGILHPAIQSLEDDKDAIPIFLLDTDAVVLNFKYPISRVFITRDNYFRNHFSLEFYGIGNKILKQLNHLGTLSHNGRQLSFNYYLGITFLDSFF